MQTYVNASAFANLDFAAEAISKAETVGAGVTAFVTNPATALALAKVKQATGSNAPLLGADPTAATSRSVLGVPLYVSASVAANTLWALDRSRVWLVLREDTTVEADRSVYDGQQQRSAGETVDTDPDTAEQWIAAGWVEPVKASRR